MKAVVATKNKIRRRQLNFFLGETYPNCTVCVYDDVLLAAKHVLENPTDVFFADVEAIKLAKMLHKFREGIVIVILAENNALEGSVEEMGINALLLDPITPEMMVEAVEGVAV